MDTGLREYIKGFDLKIKMPINGVPTWVSPNIEIDPRGDFTSTKFDPEIRIRSGVALDRPFPSNSETVRRVSPTDSTKMQLITKICNFYSYGYQIEHVTKDPIINSWLKTEFLKRFDKINSFGIVVNESSYYIDLIWERFVPLNIEEFYAMGYRFAARFALVRYELLEKTLNNNLIINVIPKEKLPLSQQW